MSSLKLMLFNVQDLFIFLDNFSSDDLPQSTDCPSQLSQLSQLNEYQWQQFTSSIYGNKELSKILDITRAIGEVKPDILMLIEVGGRESLVNFNKYFLNAGYSIYHAPSNSDRGIDVGYLVKKSLPWQFRLKAFTNITLTNLKKPTRGFFRLEILDKEHKEHKEQPKLAIILTHLKSKLDLKNEDFEGRDQRQAEVNFLLKQIKKHKNQFPLIIAGDLNGVIYRDQTEPELLGFADNDMFDVLELLHKPIEERYTYVYFNRSTNRFAMQLDYILVHKKFKNRIVETNTKVYNFKASNGKEMGLPDNRLQKSYFPSDHYPLVLEFKL